MIPNRLAPVICLSLLLSINTGCGGGTVGSSGGGTSFERSIQGYAENTNGNPLGQTKIEMSSIDGQTNQSNTDSNGTFEMEAPNGNEFTITLTPKNIPSQSIQYRSQFQAESKIRLLATISNDSSSVFRIAEATIEAENCSSFTVVGTTLTRQSNAKENTECLVKIRYSSISLPTSGFSVYANCGTSSIELMLSPVINGIATIPIGKLTNSNQICELSKIQEKSPSIQKPIIFPISD